MCFHNSLDVLKFGAFYSTKTLNFLSYSFIMHIAIKILFSQCKVLIELTHFGITWRSCDPSLWKNVCVCADFVLTPPKRLIIRDLPQLSSSPLNLIAIINTTSCTSFFFFFAFMFHSVGLEPYQWFLSSTAEAEEHLKDFKEKVSCAKE